MIKVEQPDIDVVPDTETPPGNEESVDRRGNQIRPFHIRDRTLNRTGKQPDQTSAPTGEHRRPRVIRQEIFHSGNTRLISAYHSQERSQKSGRDDLRPVTRQRKRPRGEMTNRRPTMTGTRRRPRRSHKRQQARQGMGRQSAIKTLGQSTSAPLATPNRRHSTLRLHSTIRKSAVSLRLLATARVHEYGWAGTPVRADCATALQHLFRSIT